MKCEMITGEVKEVNCKKWAFQCPNCKSLIIDVQYCRNCHRDYSYELFRKIFDKDTYKRKFAKSSQKDGGSD